MSTRAILSIDLQNDYFAGGKWPLSGIDAAVLNAAAVIGRARTTGERIIHIRHEFAGPDAPFFLAGSDGAAIHPSVAPRPGETVIVKHHANSFRDTGLKEVLDQAGITDLIIVGAMSHMCVEAAARAAVDLGYRTTVVHDAAATRDLTFGETLVPAAQVHAASMAALGFAYATLTSTAEILARWETPDDRG